MNKTLVEKYLREVDPTITVISVALTSSGYLISYTQDGEEKSKTVRHQPDLTSFIQELKK